MTKKELLLKHIIENSNSEGKIKISVNELASELETTPQTIINIFKQLSNEGIIQKDKKHITILNKSTHIVDNITSNLNYSKREKELLEYIYNSYQNRDLNFEYCSISRENIKQNTSIKNGNHISQYINKFINDGLLEKKQGKYKHAHNYKINFNNIIPMGQEEKVVISSTEYEKLNERINKMAVAFKQMMLENSQIKQENKQMREEIETLKTQLNIPTQPEIIPEQQPEQVQEPEQVQQYIPQPIVEQIETSERDNIYQQYLNNKQKVIEYIKGLERPDDKTIYTLNSVVSKVMATNDVQLVYNTCGLEYNKVFYLIPILNKVQDNIIYTYLLYKDFQEIISNILIRL